MIENLPGLPKTGQTLLITGKLRTQQFPCNGKKGTSIQIIAKQMYLCEDTNEGVKNLNHVELLAHICFDISNEETHSVFILALHNQTKYVFFFTRKFAENFNIQGQPLSWNCTKVVYQRSFPFPDFQRFRWSGNRTN